MTTNRELAQIHDQIPPITWREELPVNYLPLTSKTIANLDSLGQGPPRIKMGRKIGYPKQGLVKWLLGRTKVLV